MSVSGDDRIPLNNVEEEPTPVAVLKAQTQSSQNLNSPSTENGNMAKRSYWLWMFALFLSLIAIAFVPIYKFLFGGASIPETASLFFTSHEIAFVGVTLASTAITDFVDLEGKTTLKLLRNITLVIIGIAMYILFSVGKELSQTVNYGAIGILNILYLAATCITIAIDYKKEIKRTE